MLSLYRDTSYSNKNRLRECGAAAAFSKAIHRCAQGPGADPLVIGGLILSLGVDRIMH